MSGELVKITDPTDETTLDLVPALLANRHGIVGIITMENDNGRADIYVTEASAAQLRDALDSLLR